MSLKYRKPTPPAYNIERVGLFLQPSRHFWLREGASRPALQPTYSLSRLSFWPLLASQNISRAHYRILSSLSLFCATYILPKSELGMKKTTKKPTVWSSAWATHVFYDYFVCIFRYLWNTNTKSIVQPYRYLSIGISTLCRYVDYSVKVPTNIAMN